MFIKIRKFLRDLSNADYCNLVGEALKINNVEYLLEEINDGDRLDDIAHITAMVNGWNSDNCLVIWFKVPDRNRLALIVNNITFENLIKMTNKIIGLRAFL